MPKDYKLSYTAEQIDKRLGKVSETITFTSQDLSENQKLKARTNIGAISEDDLLDILQNKNFL